MNRRYLKHASSSWSRASNASARYPAGVKGFPFKPIVVTCSLCSEQRQFLPTEVFLGRSSHLVAKQARAGVRGRV